MLHLKALNAKFFGEVTTMTKNTFFLLMLLLAFNLNYAKDAMLTTCILTGRSFVQIKIQSILNFLLHRLLVINGTLVNMIRQLVKVQDYVYQKDQKH